MHKVLPLFLLLAGCAGAPSIQTTRMDPLQNTYELKPKVGWLNLFDDNEAIKRSLVAKAEQICGPGNIAILDDDRPDYIRVPMTPRGYLRCAGM
jgi:hypothetical protein